MDITQSKCTWNKYLAVVNLDLLFDFRSILLTLIRQINEHTSLQMSLKNSSLKSFQFYNIDEFINYFAREDQQLKEVISQKIITTKLFQTTKPLLMPSMQLFFFNSLMKGVSCKKCLKDGGETNDTSNCQNTSYDIYLYTEEAFFLQFFNQEIITLFKTVFQIEGNLRIMTAEKITKTLKQTSESTLVIAFENKRGNLFNDTSLTEVSGCEFVIISQTSPSSVSSNVKVFSDFEEFLSYFSAILFQDKEVNLEQYKALISQQLCKVYTKEMIRNSPNFFLLPLWSNYIQFQPEINVTGKVIKGFQRGSKMLGVPTANIDIDSNSHLIDDLINGVYYGTFQFESNQERSYRCVLSIGYNPFFDNEQKTIEVFLIDYEGEDFYGECAILLIQGQIRSEAAFESICFLCSHVNVSIPYPIEEFSHFPVSTDTGELIFLFIPVTELKHIQNFFSFKKQTVFKEATIIKDLEKYISDYMRRYFLTSLEKRIHRSMTNELMKQIEPAISLAIQMPEDFKEQKINPEQLQVFRNVANIVAGHYNKKEKRVNPFHYLAPKKPENKKEVGLIEKWGYSYEGTMIDPINKKNKKKKSTASSKTLTYPHMIKVLLCDIYDDFRKRLILYCLSLDKNFQDDNFERFILYIEFFVTLFSGIQIKYYIDELCYLNLDFYANEKEVMNFAEVYQYQVQFRVLNFASMIKHNEDSPVKAKHHSSSRKPNITDIYDDYDADFEQLHGNEIEVLKSLRKSNEIQFEQCEFSKVELFPPFSPFSRKIAHNLRRYDINDNYHICASCENIKSPNDIYDLLCTRKNSLFRTIDKTRLIYAALRSVLNVKEIKQVIKKRKKKKLTDEFKNIVIIHNYQAVHNLARFVTLLSAYICPIEIETVRIVNKMLKNVYGEDIGFYFLWLTHYLQWLLFPAVIGLILHLIETGMMWYKETDYFYLYMNVVFAAMVMIWVHYYLFSWDTKEGMFRSLWGMTVYKTEKTNEIAEANVDKIVFLGVTMTKERRWDVYLRRVFAGVVILLSIFVAFLCNMFVFSFEKIELYEDLDSPLALANLRQVATGYWLYIVPVLTFLLREILSVTYRQVSLWLTTKENHIHKDEFKRSHILKIIGFEFFNYYFNLYYIAFIKRYLNTCALNDCYMELANQLTIIIMTNTLLYASQLCWNVYYLRNNIKSFESKLQMDHEHLKNKSSKLIYYTRLPFTAKDVSGNILPIVYNMGYIIQFGACSPISFFFIFLQTLLVRMADGISISKLQAVKLISESQGLGVFIQVLKILAFLGILTNMTIIFFTSNIILPIDTFSKILYLLLIENLILLIFKFIHYNNAPYWFKYSDEIERMYRKKYGAVAGLQRYDDQDIGKSEKNEVREPDIIFNET